MKFQIFFWGRKEERCVSDLNDRRLTTDAVDADRVVVGRRHRHWSNIDSRRVMHEGVLQCGRLRRLERLCSDEWAFKPTSKMRRNWLTSMKGLAISWCKPGTWADWTASRTAIRLIVHIMHNCRRHFLDGGLDFRRCDWLLELASMSFWLLLRHHRRCQSTKEKVQWIGQFEDHLSIATVHAASSADSASPDSASPGKACGKSS